MDDDEFEAWKTIVLSGEWASPAEILPALCASSGEFCVYERVLKRIDWIIEHFALDVNAYADRGALLVAQVQPAYVPHLLHKHKLNLNAPISRYDSLRLTTMVVSRCKTLEMSKQLALAGVPYPDMWVAVPFRAPFVARAYCSQACCALLCALKKAPWRLFCAPQIAQFIVREMWATRAEPEIWAE